MSDETFFDHSTDSLPMPIDIYVFITVYEDQTFNVDHLCKTFTKYKLQRAHCNLIDGKGESENLTIYGQSASGSGWRAMREEGPLKSHASDAAIRVMSCGIAQICWNLHQTLTWISLMRAKLRQLTWVPRLAWAVALSARILSTSLSLECFAWLWHRCQLTTAQQRTTLTQEPLTTSVRPGMGYMHILCLMFGWSCDGERLGLCHPIRPSAFLQWGFVIYHLVVCCIIFQVSHRSWRFMSSSTVALMVLVMQNIILACAAVQRTIQSSVAFLSYGPLGPLTVMNPLHLNLWVPLVLTF